jgi:hypothetical protein
MTLISCPECKKEISDSAESCPNCGYPLTPKKTSEIKNGDGLKNGCAIGCLSIIVIAALFFIIPYCDSDFRENRSTTSSSSEVVKSSAWDGSVPQVKSWLKANLKDPDSLEFIEWSPVSKTEDGGYMVRVKYRSKNSFGGYVVKNEVFFLNSSGSVTNNIDY